MNSLRHVCPELSELFWGGAGASFWVWLDRIESHTSSGKTRTLSNTPSYHRKHTHACFLLSHNAFQVLLPSLDPPMDREDILLLRDTHLATWNDHLNIGDGWFDTARLNVQGGGVGCSFKKTPLKRNNVCAQDACIAYNSVDKGTRAKQATGMTNMANVANMANARVTKRGSDGPWRGGRCSFSSISPLYLPTLSLSCPVPMD